MKNKYKIEQVYPKIFHIIFDHNYDLAMHFLRYQEFYESPNPKFRGKQFEILDFMEWYSKEYGNGVFNYPLQWSGFNIPSKVILDISDTVGIYDENQYDQTMEDIYHKCSKILDKNHHDACWGPDFYIIGSTGDKSTISHEIAHGLFYLEKDYKKEMTALVDALPVKTKKKIFDYLLKIGYTKKVLVDECQAYLATDSPEQWNIPTNITKQFSAVYKTMLHIKK